MGIEAYPSAWGLGLVPSWEDLAEVESLAAAQELTGADVALVRECWLDGYAAAHRSLRTAREPGTVMSEIPALQRYMEALRASSAPLDMLATVELPELHMQAREALEGVNFVSRPEPVGGGPAPCSRQATAALHEAWANCFKQHLSRAETESALKRFLAEYARRITHAANPSQQRKHHGPTLKATAAITVIRLVTAGQWKASVGEAVLDAGAVMPDPGPAAEAKLEPTSEDDVAATTPEYPVHPAADMFPMMEEARLNELAEDIAEHGLIEPILVYEGTIIDGRNRLEACRRAGVTPKYVEWTGTGSVVSYVLSSNLHRRHLTDSQRAMIAARAKLEFGKEARIRRSANLKRGTEVPDGLDPAHRDSGRSAEKAASVANVSVDATKKAAKVLQQGDPALIEAVERNAVSLDAAATVADLTPEEQRHAVQSNTASQLAKKIRARKRASRTAAGASAGTDEVKIALSEISTGKVWNGVLVGMRITVTGAPDEILIRAVSASESSVKDSTSDYAAGGDDDEV